MTEEVKKLFETYKDYERLSGIDLKNMKVIDKQKAFTSEFISKLSWQDSSF